MSFLQKITHPEEKKTNLGFPMTYLEINKTGVAASGHHLSQESRESQKSQECHLSQECQERLRTLYVFAT